MSKLTLNVDEQVVLRAKRYAKQRGLSVSQMVETYLSAVAEPPGAAAKATPILRSVRGMLKTGSAADYRKHLEEKYR
jgi:hypothetical protein